MPVVVHEPMSLVPPSTGKDEAILSGTSLRARARVAAAGGNGNTAAVAKTEGLHVTGVSTVFDENHAHPLVSTVATATPTTRHLMD